MVRPIDAAGYEVIWDVSDLRYGSLGSWAREDSSGRQLRPRSGGDGAGMREGRIEGCVDAMASIRGSHRCSEGWEDPVSGDSLTTGSCGG